MLIDVLSNDTDINNDILTITTFTQGSNGTVSQEGNSLRYTPDVNFRETDSFDYEISDGNGGIASATVSIIVNITSSLTSMHYENVEENTGVYEFPFTIVSKGRYVFETSQYLESCDTVLELLDVNDEVIAYNDNYVDPYAVIIIYLEPGDYNLITKEKNSERLTSKLEIFVFDN